jgi:NADPH2:quinone reductase
VKAWQAARLGEPGEVLELVEVDRPVPGPGQVLVRVRAAALNFADVLLVRGQYQARPPLPFTPGVELCGEVIAVGAGDSGLAGGDRLAGGSGGGDGGAGLAAGRRVIGTAAMPHGALAEYALMEAAEAFPAPEGLDDAAASALHIAYQTGWFGLHRRAGLRAGETLLVHAGAGGVGSAAVQLGKAAGARVLAVVGGSDKAAAAKALGADVVIDRRAEDVVAAVKKATGGRGADVVYDPVGGAAFAASTRCVAFEGRILIVGFAGGEIPSPALSHALVKNYSLLGLHWGLYRTHDPAAVRAAYEELAELAAAGVVAPLVGRRLPPERAVEGLTALAAGETIGRVVVQW